MSNILKEYNPDVLNCLANLSSDEVFTSPELVNKMLDELPQELFSNKNSKFLDPSCKTGIFLREITKRLIKGLENDIPNLGDRVEHILKNQIYGIAITEITSLLTRRSVYCSKKANSDLSIVKFDNVQGNIRFKTIEHSWENKKCKYCGTNENEFKRSKDLETHAYEFIHNPNIEEIFNMKFDVIISNPPYQLNDGGGTGTSAKPIYNKFVETAKKLNPRYISMIIPSRWMTGGKGLDAFRDEMINDKRFEVLHDFADAKECFNGVDVKGGVCYFLWNREYNGQCNIYRHTTDETRHTKRFLKDGEDNIYIREDRLIPIKNKVWKNKETQSFMDLVFSRKSYGIPSNFLNDKESIKKYKISDKDSIEKIAVWGLEGSKRIKKFANRSANVANNANINKYKVFLAKAYGCGEIGEVASTPILSTPILSTPNEICTETFLEIGSFDNIQMANNAYIYTKFFRALVGIKKQTQNTSKQTYQYVPIQDFSSDSDIDWTKPISEIDKQLYKKYGFTNEEIDFIETNITEMKVEN